MATNQLPDDVSSVLDIAIGKQIQVQKYIYITYKSSMTKHRVVQEFGRDRYRINTQDDASIMYACWMMHHYSSVSGNSTLICYIIPRIYLLDCHYVDAYHTGYSTSQV